MRRSVISRGLDFCTAAFKAFHVSIALPPLQEPGCIFRIELRPQKSASGHSRSEVSELSTGTLAQVLFTHCAKRSSRRRRPGHSERAVVLGILSLIIWALVTCVTAKYVLILLRADNKGEGGTLALMALASRSLVRRRQYHYFSWRYQRRAFLRRRDHNAGAVGAFR